VVDYRRLGITLAEILLEHTAELYPPAPNLFKVLGENSVYLKVYYGFNPAQQPKAETEQQPSTPKAETPGEEARVETPQAEAKPATAASEAPGGHMAPPPGMPAEHYCLECASKHVGTAKILLREALQRAEKGEPPELVLEKVRGAYEELMGAEDDTMSVSDEGIRRLNSMIRDLRKWFFTTGAIVKPDKNIITEAYSKITQLNNTIYDEYAKRLEKAIESMERVEAKMETLKEAMKTKGASMESMEALERAEAKLKELKQSMKAKLEEVRGAKLEAAQAG
jgi:cell fate (sporulation/competence/biofilm development) regulator YmcA (YheA/YmcA/DUF963 family)